MRLVATVVFILAAPWVWAAPPVLWAFIDADCPVDAFAPETVACSQLRVDADLLRSGGPHRLAVRFPVSDSVPPKQMPMPQTWYLRQTVPSRDGTVWNGRVEGDSHSNVTLAPTPTGVIGLISTSSGPAYRIRAIAAGRTAVELVSSAVLSDDTHENVFSPMGVPSLLKSACVVPQTVEITVLAVYTPKARDWADGDQLMFRWLAIAESRVNQSFAQSGVHHRIRLAAPRLVAYEESGNNETDLARLRVGDAKWARDIRLWRKASGADLVILVTSNIRRGGHAEALNSANLETPGAFAEVAFAVVPIQSLSSSDAFAHELGHLMGAGHVDDPQTSEYSVAYRQTDPDSSCGRWSTIMDGDAAGAAHARILYWSNAQKDILLCGQSMGEADRVDNARTLNETAAKIATFSCLIGDQ